LIRRLLSVAQAAVGFYCRNCNAELKLLLHFLLKSFFNVSIAFFLGSPLATSLFFALLSASHLVRRFSARRFLGADLSIVEPLIPLKKLLTLGMYALGYP
jgi:hypothetical protein